MLSLADTKDLRRYARHATLLYKLLDGIHQRF